MPFCGDLSAMATSFWHLGKTRSPRGDVSGGAPPLTAAEKLCYFNGFRRVRAKVSFLVRTSDTKSLALQPLQNRCKPLLQGGSYLCGGGSYLCGGGLVPLRERAQLCEFHSNISLFVQSSSWSHPVVNGRR